MKYCQPLVLKGQLDLFPLQSHGILLAPFFLCEPERSSVLVEVIAARLLKD